MTSYLSSLTDRYSSLKRLLPTSLNEDSDLTVSNPNDSHVSRVLRAHYTEKGRPFPAWLGPDPNEKQRSAATPALVNANFSSTSLNSSSASLRGSRGAGGLGDLFSDGTPDGGPGPQNEPLSLRSRRPVIRSPGVGGGSADSIPYPQRVAQAPVPASNSTSSLPSARPLPSQRIGSYQTRQATPPFGSRPDSSSSASTTTSVQDRLKARLGGGSRGASPVTDTSANSSTSASAGYDGGGGGGRYGGGGGGQNPYVDTAGPERPAGPRHKYSGSNSSNPYLGPSPEGNSTNPYIGQSKPYTGATSPWVSGEEPQQPPRGYGSSNPYGGSSQQGQGGGRYR
ncbi:MAG: hypothetical protein MMC33_008801 [Icmadophila ericetorum]|nr:hypothetical protein [Icmadophila ericetorum]